uniref:Fucosyltransferase n=1 Tax=Phallusia mammillata TaxID=59560 RepID=A0A6F9DDF1_9ASCI|nr:alpha-(1,3)-fucosyltransferase 9-like [Phallusia mammillata]
MKYVKDLLKHNLDIDLGGRCFKDRSENFNNEKYKFYFAFENSWNCSDYITEKFWRNALSYGTVPVVLGAVKGDYLKIAPPNSFIYAHDFKSPKEIAEYLKYLDRNQTAYVEYLNWMKQPKRASPMANRERGITT